MATLALAKGNKADELRRIKEKSRKTQAFLSESKKVQSSSMKDTSSPERSMKATMVSQSSAGSTAVNQASIIVDLLLFGQSAAMKKGMGMTSSFANTSGMSTTTTGGHVNQVMPLRYIVRNCPITRFEIASTNADGTRKEAQQDILGLKKAGKEKKVGGPKSNALKIQFLLDQRKPPTEKLPSLCAQYDDSLNKVSATEVHQ